MYTPQHEITFSPSPTGPSTSPFLFGAVCSCKQWLWMPNTLPNTMAAAEQHYIDTSMVLPAERQDPK